MPVGPCPLYNLHSPWLRHCTVAQVFTAALSPYFLPTTATGRWSSTTQKNNQNPENESPISDCKVVLVCHPTASKISCCICTDQYASRCNEFVPWLPWVSEFPWAFQLQGRNQGWFYGFNPRNYDKKFECSYFFTKVHHFNAKIQKKFHIPARVLLPRSWLLATRLSVEPPKQNS